MAEQQRPTDIVEVRGPYPVYERELKHDQFGMQLIHDKIRRPDGNQGNYFWVNFVKPAVLIIPMDKFSRDGNVYMGREFTYAENQYSTELSGGSLNEGETPEEAAVRKVKDELGIEIRRDELVRVGPKKGYGEITSRVRNRTHVFAAEVKSIGEPSPYAGDDISRQIMTYKNVMRLIDEGEIYTGVVAASFYALDRIIDNLQRQ